MATVTILRGTTRGKTVSNKTFTLLKGYAVGAISGEGFVTVDGTKLYGRPTARIRVNSPKDFVINGSVDEVQALKPKAAASSKPAAIEETQADEETNETDVEIVTRINRRFEILNKLAFGARQGEIRSLFVIGAPGVGKTYGVETTLRDAGLAEIVCGLPPRYTIISGAMTPPGLYSKLYEYRDENSVIVLDDCDSVFTEELALNLLKAALDTSKRRMIHWNVESILLRKNDIPNSFEFKGSIIFISNINFKKVRSERMRNHLTALMSRSHFLDLTVHTQREKLLRIEDLIANKGMLQQFNLTDALADKLIQFIRKHANRFNELSLRTVIKLAGLIRTFQDNDEWMEVAELSMMDNLM